MALRMTRPKMFAIFLGIALGGAALVAFLFSSVWSQPGPSLRAVTVVHLMPVLLATLAVQGPILRQPVLEPLGLKAKPSVWWLVALLAPIGVLAVALLAERLAGLSLALDVDSYLEAKRALLSGEQLAAFDEQVRENPPSDPKMYVLEALLAGVTFNLLLALATEIGWRGFLFREVQGGFWRRSLLIGLAEGAFLAPIAALGWQFLEAGAPERFVWGPVLVVAWSMVASPSLVYLRVRSDSVIAVAAFRGTLWALTAIAADLGPFAGPFVRPFYGWTGIVGMVALLAVFLLHDRFVAKQRLATGA